MGHSRQRVCVQGHFYVSTRSTIQDHPQPLTSNPAPPPAQHRWCPIVCPSDKCSALCERGQMNFVGGFFPFASFPTRPSSIDHHNTSQTKKEEKKVHLPFSLTTFRLCIRLNVSNCLLAIAICIAYRWTWAVPICHSHTTHSPVDRQIAR